MLPAWDPIRAAEELAVLDQLTKGRIYAGFARGYQDRWVNVLGQQYHVTGAPMDGSAIDTHNRSVYEETLKVIKKAWTEEAWDYNGEYYKVPYPYEEGIRRWPVAEWTREYGAPGEVDAEGVVRKICVVPRPYQDPHPPLFQPFSVRENTIRYTAQSGIVPWILVAYPPDFNGCAGSTRRSPPPPGATSARRKRRRLPRRAFRQTEAEAVELFRQTNYAGFQKYFGGFGFAEAFRLLGTRKVPADRRCCRPRSGPSTGSATPSTRWPVRSTR